MRGVMLRTDLPFWGSCLYCRYISHNNVTSDTRKYKVAMTPSPHNKPVAGRRALLAEACVVPESARCVQCGICSYSCPIAIDVRRHAWSGEPVKDSRCLTCGECIARCPRGVLSFERSSLFAGALPETEA